MQLETLGEGRFLRLVRKGTWEYAERTKVNGIVIIVPVLDDGTILFVEQFRPPVDAICIEFPAGLSGDATDTADEQLVEAARRELLEETGYEAATLEFLATASPSAGLTSEVMSYYVARGLHRVASGGGVEHEQIICHEVPAADVRNWLAAQSQRAIVSAPVYAGLYLAEV
jgi:ADP-ribose pyrophosphatase